MKSKSALREPNFERLRIALRGGQPDRVPLLELIVDRAIQTKLMSRHVKNVEDSVEFFTQFGYDAIRVSPIIDFNPAKLEPSGGLQVTPATDSDISRTWHCEGEGVIINFPSFDRYQWPRPEDVDYSEFEKVARVLPEGMKIIGHYGDIFTWVWNIMGLQSFCFAIVENPGLVALMFDRVGRIVYNLFENIVTMDSVGAIWYSDDLAYRTGPMVAPQVYRDHLFPWMKRIGHLCREYDLPYIYHSDGMLWPLMDDLIETGIDALHPIEPLALDIREVKARYGDRICIAGNMDLEYTLTRARPEEAAEVAKRLLRDVALGGGYCMGSSNTIPAYVKPENYRAMIETTLQHGVYPISV